MRPTSPPGIAARLLLAGLALDIAGRATGSQLLDTAGAALTLGGAAIGAAWATHKVYKLARAGQGCTVLTYATMTLWALTPWGLKAQARQLMGEAALRRRRARVGEAPELEPPFTGCWIVVRGGVTREDSHSWDLLTQRYAYDLVKSEDRDRLERPCKYPRLEDWDTYGSPVAAAGEGVVVEARDGVPDNEPVGRIRPSSPSLEGNHVVVEHPGGYYTLYAHLRRGSVGVRPGERVEAGQVLGEAGNSGMSTAPHLHFQAMDGPSLYSSASIPFKLRYRGPGGGERVGHPGRGYVICRQGPVHS